MTNELLKKIEEAIMEEIKETGYISNSDNDYTIRDIIRRYVNEEEYYEKEIEDKYDDDSVEANNHVVDFLYDNYPYVSDCSNPDYIKIFYFDKKYNFSDYKEFTKYFGFVEGE